MDPREAARARARLAAEVRRALGARGYEEVETPCLVPAPGMEPHVQAFETRLEPGDGGPPLAVWLHTSPEYAMKRLLARGFESIYQLARAFRNGEVSDAHNPEFTMLELYRVGAGYREVMEDLERLLESCARAVAGGTLLPGGLEMRAPFERLAVADAFREKAGVDLAACGGDAGRLREAARAAGLDPGRPGDRYDDLFFRIFLDRVEPGLGQARPVYLLDWPAPLAALSRLRLDDPRFAERFELYAGGLELANGFSELTDSGEQRRRLLEEQEARRALGRQVYPIDERFLADLQRMPPAGGVAVGLDRVLMLLLGARSIDEVLLFPAREMLRP